MEIYELPLDLLGCIYAPRWENRHAGRERIRHWMYCENMHTSVFDSIIFLSLESKERLS